MTYECVDLKITQPLIKFFWGKLDGKFPGIFYASYFSKLNPQATIILFLIF